MKLALILFLIFSFSVAAKASHVEAPPPSSLSLLTEEWGPITFEEKGKAQGFAVDVVSAIQERLKINNAIEVVPWTRGFRELKTQPNVVLFTVIRNKEREKMFTLLGPLGSCEVSFYGLATKNLPVKNVDDAKHVNGIAAKQDTLFASTLEKKGFKNLVLTKDPQQEARLLAAGHVDLISNDPLIIEQAFKDIGRKDVKLRRYLTVEKGDLYIAFSKGTSYDTMAQWKKALAEIKQDGTFAKLVRKWLPETTVLQGVQLIGYGITVDAIEIGSKN